MKTFTNYIIIPHFHDSLDMKDGKRLHDEYYILSGYMKWIHITIAVKLEWCKRGQINAMPCGTKMLTDTSLLVICGMCVWEEEDGE